MKNLALCVTLAVFAIISAAQAGEGCCPSKVGDKAVCPAGKQVCPAEKAAQEAKKAGAKKAVAPEKGAEKLVKK